MLAIFAGSQQLGGQFCGRSPGSAAALSARQPSGQQEYEGREKGRGEWGVCGSPPSHTRPSNFGRSVLGCSEADFFNKIFSLQRFSKSTRVSHSCSSFVGWNHVSLKYDVVLTLSACTSNVLTILSLGFYGCFSRIFRLGFQLLHRSKIKC